MPTLDELFPGWAGPSAPPENTFVGAYHAGEEWFAALGKVHSATVEESDYLRNSQANHLALRDAYQRRIDAIEAATGAKLTNPLNTVEGTSVGGQLFGDTRSPAQAAINWSMQTQELAGKFPQQRQIILGGKTVDEEATDLARQSERRLSDSLSDPRLGPVGRLLGGLSGSVVGAVRDPMQAPLLFAGGAFFGGGRTVLGNIARMAASEAVVNAGMEAAVQPFEQARRKSLGLEHGLAQAAESIGTAAAIGAGFGVFGGAAHALLSRLRGEGKIDAQTESLIRQAEQSNEADDVAFGSPPAGITKDEAASLKAQAIVAVESPDRNPLPVGPVPKPERSPAVSVLVDENAAPRSVDVGSRPVQYQHFNPAEIGTDARAFQYKDGGDAAGVTDRLAGVTRWDPMASGKVFVFEAKDGRKIIADGHQRLGLAKRLSAAGQDVALDGYLFREADGWTVPEVRAMAAKKNMQEGSGSAVDAARILRDQPDILDASLPTTGPMMKKAQGLARLSDDAWRMTINGMIPDNQAALVGEMVANPAQHVAVLSDLRRYSPATEREARLLIQEIQASGTVHETQTDMFGSFDSAKTLIAERVKVLDAALQTLRNDKRVFGELAKNADLIEAAGNQLDRNTNRSRALSADFIATLVEKMARSKGEMSEALTDAARAVAEGKSITGQSRTFLNDVQKLIEKHGLGRLLREADAPPPVLKPAVAPEPGSAEALALAQAAAPIDRGGTSHAGVPRQDTAAPITDRAEINRAFLADRPERTMDELYQVAPAHQETLNALGAELASKTGAIYKAAKIKARATAEEKMVRNNYTSANELTDIVRGGFIVKHPGAAEEIVRSLAGRYTLLDKGWFKNREGYLDRKALIRFDDGTIGELQFWEPALLAAKEEGGGHKLYEEWRSTKNKKRKAELAKQMRELYSAAMSEAGAGWSNLEMSSVPKLFSKDARQSSSGMTAAEWNTSASSTLTQSAPGESLAYASKDGSSSTAGRNSQSQNTISMENPSYQVRGEVSAQNQELSSGNMMDEPTLWDVLPAGQAADASPVHVTAADLLDQADRTDFLAQTAELCTRS